MRVKEVKPINFLYFRTETRVSDLLNFVHIGQDLYREAVKKNLTITGPVHWHYFGFDVYFLQTTSFIGFLLAIALPKKCYGVIRSDITTTHVFTYQSLERERQDATGVLLREGTRLQ
jgi:hypothetical protein